MLKPVQTACLLRGGISSCTTRTQVSEPLSVFVVEHRDRLVRICRYPWGLPDMASGSDAACGELAYDFVGDSSGWVEAYTECPHLHHLNADTQHLPRFDALCATCKDPTENWLCLSCHEVYCGRYINKHMLAHSKDASHPLAAGFRDLSVWCFDCEHYLDAQVILQLRPIFEALHLMKFGDPAPARAELRSGDPLVLELS